jgi:hypothetical protein
MPMPTFPSPLPTPGPFFGLMTTWLLPVPEPLARMRSLLVSECSGAARPDAQLAGFRMQRDSGSVVHPQLDALLLTPVQPDAIAAHVQRALGRQQVDADGAAAGHDQVRRDLARLATRLQRADDEKVVSLVARPEDHAELSLAVQFVGAAVALAIEEERGVLLRTIRVEKHQPFPGQSDISECAQVAFDPDQVREQAVRSLVLRREE